MKENLCTKYLSFTYKYVTLNKKAELIVISRLPPSSQIEIFQNEFFQDHCSLAE